MSNQVADCSIRVGRFLCEMHFNKHGFTVCASDSYYLPNLTAKHGTEGSRNKIEHDLSMIWA